MKISKLLTLRFVLLLLTLLAARPLAAQNFNLTMQPNSATLIPGQNSSFVVSLTPFNGFTNPVTLTAIGLPAGVTAQFSPATLSLPGTSILQLSATTNATLGEFTLNVSAGGGGITNTTSSSVTVNFGLLPLCYGTFQGVVTDIQTGLPVPGATVTANNYYLTTADANGFYSITNVALGSPNNTPVEYGLVASRTDYWYSASSYAYAVCDATNIVNLQIIKRQTANISGHLTVQGGGVLTNVSVLASGPSGYLYALSDTSGFYDFTNVPLGYSNTPAYYSIQTSPDNYWPAYSNATVAVGTNAVVDFSLDPVCTATIQGQVFYADSTVPVTNVLVVVTTSRTFYAVTDTNGVYLVTNATLGTLNVPITAGALTSPSGYYTASTNTLLSTCGQAVVEPDLFITPIPVLRNNYGSVTGHVYDATSGLPLTNVYVFEYPSYAGTRSDASGGYYITNIFVGTGTVTNSNGAIETSQSGFFDVYSNVTVYSDLVTTQDVFITDIGYGAIAGTVRDANTTLPVTNANVSINFSYVPVTNGFYFSGPLPLSAGNPPTTFSVNAGATGYWPIQTNTLVTLDTTNIFDINLIKVCTGATIVGNVVDAITQKPITNATITAVGSQYYYAYTDTNGSFIFTNITVGNDNSPIQSTLTASAPGYNPQTKSVTIFCNATIFTEFGQAETVFGSINGFVTNVVTGLPLTNVFVGTGFGGATYTDTNGYYSFGQVPLGANGAATSWTVTAIPGDFNPQTESIGVSSNNVSRLDFGFGEPPTALIVGASGNPDPVNVGSNLLYLVTLTNTVADAQQVVFSDLLPGLVTYVTSYITNSPGTPFSAPVYSNNIVSISADTFASNSVVTLAILVTPTISGTLTNVASVSSTTTDLDPTGTNHTATVLTSVVAPVAPVADLALFVTEDNTSLTLGSNITYTLSITNIGPNDAPDVTLDDIFPPGAVFVSSAGTQGSQTHTGSTAHWDFGAVSGQSGAVATLVLTPSLVGSITNFALVTLVPGGSSVIDPNLANNSNSIVATVTAVVTTNPPPLTNVAVQALGPITFNPQTGLYQQSVLFTNLSGSSLGAVRIAVLSLPSFVSLYNATGKTNGTPYVEYDQTVGTNGGFVFLLEYYDATRATFTSTNFAASAVAASSPAAPSGSVLQLDRAQFLSEGQLTIEFASTPGHTNVVQNTDTLGGTNWSTAWPPIVATGTKTQWIDAGPPKTTSAPGVGSRYYRIVQTN